MNIDISRSWLKPNPYIERARALETQVNQLRSLVDEYSRRLATKDSLITSLQNQLTELKKRNPSRVAQQQAQEQQIKSLEAQLADMKRALSSKDAELNRLRQEISTLRNIVDKSKPDGDAIKTYKTQVRSLQSQVEQLQARLLKAEAAPALSLHTDNPPAKREPHSHVPYVYEVTESNKNSVVAGSEIYCYVQDDEHRGLGTPGRAGVIKNDGPGNITYRLYDKTKDKWSFPSILRPGEAHQYDYNDNVHVSVVEIIPDSDKTMFRVQFTAGLED